MIEQSKFTYFPLEKALEKQKETIDDQGKKQIDALKVLKFDAQQLAIKDEVPEYQLSDEAKTEIEKIKEIDKTMKIKKSFYAGENDTCDFRHLNTIRSFTKNTFNNKISLDEADENQVELLIHIMDFKKKKKAAKTRKSVSRLFDGREMVYKGFKSGIFPINQLKVQDIQIC